MTRRLVTAALAGGTALALAGCGGTSASPSSTSSSPTTTAGSAGATTGATASASADPALTAALVAPPAGYALSTAVGSRTGPLDATAFDGLIGDGAAKQLGFRSGTAATFGRTGTSDSLEVDLFRFAAVSGAADFATTAEKGVVGDTTPAPSVGAAAGIAQGVAITPTAAASDGSGTYGVIAVRGTIVMIVDLSAAYGPGPASAVLSVAQDQYARLAALGS